MADMAAMSIFGDALMAIKNLKALDLIEAARRVAGFLKRGRKEKEK